ncbi:Hypothetical protein of unknown function [Bradyrhizobium sp. ORS 285]|nr:Hypothetical hypothetical protein [Bradyrhizobium sp. ORS 285]SMX61257.1 Hypothetical protein of unknown function [Bradyrhizobium sp. ORS 285]
MRSTVGLGTGRTRARQRAVDIARLDPPDGISPDKALAEVREVLDSLGDTCPECVPE